MSWAMCVSARIDTRAPREKLGEQGQMVISLLVVVCIALIGFSVLLVVPIGAATDERTRSQTAADAAALAGAEAIRTDWLDRHTRPRLLTYSENSGEFGGDDPHRTNDPGRSIDGGSGGSDAQTFAHRNGARLTSYLVDPINGRVSVQVENMYTADERSGRARSRAVAELDINFRNCRWNPSEPPPRPDEGGPREFRATLICGTWSASYLVDNVSEQRPTRSYGPGSTRLTLDSSLEPRLVD